MSVTESKKQSFLSTKPDSSWKNALSANRNFTGSVLEVMVDIEGFLRKRDWRIRDRRIGDWRIKNEISQVLSLIEHVPSPTSWFLIGEYAGKIHSKFILVGNTRVLLIVLIRGIDENSFMKLTNQTKVLIKKTHLNWQ